MRTDFLIIGGGIAGLSAANRLAEAGADVVVLESGIYPAQKICGEFLSPEALPLLEKWEIPPAALINGVTFVMQKKEWSFHLPQTAGTISRHTFDEALAQRAIKKGAHIQTNAAVETIEVPKNSRDPFVVSLASGEEWRASKLLLSTGRVTRQQKPPHFRYIGIKAHFEGISGVEDLKVYLAQGAYIGMAPVGNGRVNVAGLIACSHEEALDPSSTWAAFLERTEASVLKNTLAKGHHLFPDWLKGAVPEFGIRPQTEWPRTFLLGDAAGVIPPATGSGLAMGLFSGILAAECAMNGGTEDYKRRWNQEFAQRISKGMLLHRLYMTPWLAGTIPLISQLFPNIPHYVFKSTRGKFRDPL